MPDAARGLALGAWDRPVPPIPAAVVVAPHPDDEVLGTGALLASLAAAGVPVVLVAVTDGEASHARSQLVDPDELVVRRAAEREEALRRLGVAPVTVHRMHLPDGAVGASPLHGPRLADALADVVLDLAALVAPASDASGPSRPDGPGGRSHPFGSDRPPDRSRPGGRPSPAGSGESTGSAVIVGTPVLLAPWRHDGHPDHEATGRAAAVAAARTGARLGEVAIWAKVAGSPPPGAARFTPGPELAGRKRHAAAAFASQLEAQGPSPLDGPVVHPHELAAMLAGPEVVAW